MYSNISFLLLRNKLPIIVDLQVTNRNLENSVAQIVLGITNISLQLIRPRSLWGILKNTIKNVEPP